MLDPPNVERPRTPDYYVRIEVPDALASRVIVKQMLHERWFEIGKV